MPLLRTLTCYSRDDTFLRLIALKSSVRGSANWNLNSILRILSYGFNALYVRYVYLTHSQTSLLYIEWIYGPAYYSFIQLVVQYQIKPISFSHRRASSSYATRWTASYPIPALLSPAKRHRGVYGLLVHELQWCKRFVFTTYCMLWIRYTKSFQWQLSCDLQRRE